jgi:hypothetical protein
MRNDARLPTLLKIWLSTKGVSGLSTLTRLHLQHLQRLGGLEKLLLIYTMKNLVRKEVYFAQLSFFFGMSH